MSSSATERKVENARTNLKIAIALSDMSASEVSTKAGLSVNLVGKYLRNENMLSFSKMQAVCDVVGIPLGLIVSEHQITPARIRLYKLMERMTETEISELLNP